jgi:TolB-like protein
MKKRSTLFVLLAIVIVLVTNAQAQNRIAVLPFQNMDGKFEFNQWCYSLQDTLSKALVAADPEQLNYRIVPADSVEAALADLNLDPANPQYFTDMWKAIAKLNVKKVVCGSFIVEGKSMLIKAAVYDVKLKLPHPKYQATNIFKDLDKAFEAVDEILNVVKPGMM